MRVLTDKEQVKAYEDGYNMGTRDAENDNKEKIQELVEWVATEILPLTKAISRQSLAELNRKWQAKLKEWGIEQEGKKMKGNVKPEDCDWGDCCDCISIKSQYCETCKWYHGLDSGYGYCVALPNPIVVAWCKDVCSFFVQK